MDPATATRSIVGVDADLLAVAAAFIGPTLAVAIGGYLTVRHFFNTREATEVRQRYVTDGLSRLRTNILELNTISLMNYQIALELTSTLRDYDRESPLAPHPDALPELITVEPQLVSFQPVAVVTELLGESPFPKWWGHVFSDATLAYRLYESRLRQPMRRYYNPEVDSSRFAGNREETARTLVELTERMNKKATRHLPLHAILYDIELEFLHRDIRRYKQVGSLKKTPRVKELLAMMSDEYEKIEKESEIEREGSEPSETSS